MSAKSGLTLREEHRLTVFKNRALRGIFGLKREERWRELHNKIYRKQSHLAKLG
jgi:hypothetical protein